SSVKTFLIFRALRIVPALTAEITLSALILGPLVTSVALSAYFFDPTFARYFTNVVGIIRYQLPGVFLDNPLPGIVNGQLWTVPSELHCYIALAVLMVVRLSTKRHFMAAVLFILAVGESATVLLPNHHYTADVLNAPEMLVLSFLCGNVFFLWKEKIPASAWLFVASIGGYCFVTYLLPAAGFTLGIVSATYFIVYLGTLRMPRIPVLMSGDYSYGIYLYSFPIQQAALWAAPSLRIWYINLAIATPLTILFAAASWHYLEKPALSLRKWLAPKAVLNKDTPRAAEKSAASAQNPITESNRTTMPVSADR
ncbi:MAG TPA: acyltransferase, partial [Candidatus Cybelea sp.]|nr:acyltransferase [Candidatus Cybelea sp.]